MDYPKEKAIYSFIDLALEEDLGDGDHSSLASIPADSENSVKAVLKDNQCIIAGIELAQMIYARLDRNIVFEPFFKDGDIVKKRDKIFTASGNSRKLLSGERLVLNCMQRMSGIASYANSLRSLIKGTKVKLLDTRKTTPNFRLCEKWAVKIGGAENHRLGLYDMIMLKDNHIDFAGGVAQAIRSTLDYLAKTGKKLKIVVETRTLEEVAQVMNFPQVDRILFDNMSLESMKQAIQLIDGRYLSEASGGIYEKNIRAIEETGVDYISMGALTHSAKSIDISIKAT